MTTHSSINDLRERLAHEDLELSCTLHLPVQIAIFHPNTPELDAAGNPRLDPGYVVELCIPPQGSPQFTTSFVLSHDPNQTFSLEQLLQALHFDPDAPLWTVKALLPGTRDENPETP